MAARADGGRGVGTQTGRPARRRGRGRRAGATDRGAATGGAGVTPAGGPGDGLASGPGSSESGST